MRILGFDLSQKGLAEYGNYTAPLGLLRVLGAAQVAGASVDFLSQDQPIPDSYDIYMTSLTTAQLRHFDWAVLNNSKFWGKCIMVGGPHPSFCSFSMLKRYEGVINLYVCLGEGEESVFNFIQEKTTKNVYNDKSKLDGCLGRNRSLDWPMFLSSELLNYRYIPIFVGMGCQGRCKFCVDGDNPLRLCSLDFFKSEAKRLKEFFGNAEIHYGLTSDIPKLYIDRGYLDVMITEGLTPSYLALRADDIVEKRLDLSYLREVGWKVGLGAETGSDRLLEVIGKGITSDQWIEASRMLVDAGFFVHLFMMYRLPSEEDEDRVQTVRCLRKAKYHSYALKRFIPHPGSHMYHYSEMVGIDQESERGYWEVEDKSLEFQVLLRNLEYYQTKYLGNLKRYFEEKYKC